MYICNIHTCESQIPLDKLTHRGCWIRSSQSQDESAFKQWRWRYDDVQPAAPGGLVVTGKDLWLGDS